MTWRRWLRPAVVATALVGCSAGWWTVASWRRNAELVRVRALMGADRFPEARVLLTGLAARWSSDPEVAYRTKATP